MKTSHIYPGANTLNAYLTVKNCDQAIEFYKKAFGAIEKGRLFMPDKSIGHAEIEIEGTLLMLGEENLEWGNKSPLTIGGNPVSLSLYVKDADASYQKAIDAGATAVMPLKDEFYGDRIGQVSDPFGYKWTLATHFKTLTFEEMQYEMDKLFL